MFLQTIWPNKRLITQMAGVGPHPCVTSNMYSQHVPINKFLITIRAFMFLFFTVHPSQMIIQISGTFKYFRADFANAHFFGVCGHVDINRRRSPSLIITQFTIVKSFFTVRFQVYSHCSFRWESFTTGLANVVFSVRMNCYNVLLEGCSWIKTATALQTPGNISEFLGGKFRGFTCDGRCALSSGASCCFWGWFCRIWGTAVYGSCRVLLSLVLRSRSLDSYHI